MTRWLPVIGLALAHAVASCGSAAPAAPARVQHGALPKPWIGPEETPDAPFRAQPPELGGLGTVSRSGRPDGLPS